MSGYEHWSNDLVYDGLPHPAMDPERRGRMYKCPEPDCQYTRFGERPPTCEYHPYYERGMEEIR